jgi:hypothetical protein
VNRGYPGQQWKCGDEFLPFHPQASHVPAEYRDGWNRCYASSADQIRKLREALELLYAAYCDQMHSEYDFPGNPWTPERDDDTAALTARAAIKETE